MRIEFTPEAVKDIEGTKTYLLVTYGEKTASDNVKKVMERISSLKQFPNQGCGVWERYGIESDYRYIYVNHNYVFYRVVDENVRIIRILDARCDFLRVLFGINDQTDNE